MTTTELKAAIESAHSLARAVTVMETDEGYIIGASMAATPFNDIYGIGPTPQVAWREFESNYLRAVTEMISRTLEDKA